ncbi:MAG: hypothetical protein WBW49_12760, partial [Candidatus Acidiferrum sp.]
AGVRNLAQLASRLFLSIRMAMGNGLNEENEGDNGQGNTHRPGQTLLRYKPIPHPAVDLTPMAS